MRSKNYHTGYDKFMCSKREFWIFNSLTVRKGQLMRMECNYEREDTKLQEVEGSGSAATLYAVMNPAKAPVLL